ncbi:hypothetical protein HEB29_005472 [Streptomyces fulvorobeus]|uniref:Uncharacterized protein n=1 Tax=Streptomyces fulvorobeus TaxID=284028 RepID=A0A7Y9HHQ7_9ACTN|nr:hypothetical protein [Streptomyces fulvorobeus]
MSRVRAAAPYRQTAPDIRKRAGRARSASQPASSSVFSRSSVLRMLRA